MHHCIERVFAMPPPEQVERPADPVERLRPQPGTVAVHRTKRKGAHGVDFGRLTGRRAGRQA
jgi:hypothetical protein